MDGTITDYVRALMFASIASIRNAVRIANIQVADGRRFVCDFPRALDAVFRAALEVRLAQRGLAMLAALRAFGLIERPQRLAWVLNRAAGAFDFLGSALGGMVVQVLGVDRFGQASRRTWNIIAPDDHGPEIPCMAAMVLTRRLARTPQLPVGAFACVGKLSLVELEPEFARRAMTTDIVDERIDHGTAVI